MHQGSYSVHISICPLVFGCPLLGSSCTSSRPFLNRLCNSKALDFFISYSPQTTVNRANVSLAILPIFTQNLIFICCSRFSSLIFLPTVYHGHVLLPLLLGTNDSFGLSLMQTQVGTCPNVLEYTSLHESTPQRHAATLPGNKLSHHVTRFYSLVHHTRCFAFLFFLYRFDEATHQIFFHFC